MSIPISYFRSSSYNCWRDCQQKYYLDYVLGLDSPSNQAADKGTIVHKILEICAACKLAYQQGKDKYVDDILGELDSHNYEEKYLDGIIDSVYSYYRDAFDTHKWTEKDYKDCVNWTWKALRYNDGLFDPKNREIATVEAKFKFPLEYDWASYKDDSGKQVQLQLQGTIDRIDKEDDGVYEIVDYKTGKYRKDWATGKTKEQEDFFIDAQLRIYHMATLKLFPDATTVLITIFYINAGGAYTVHFQEKDLELTEKMLKKKFEEISTCKVPQLITERDSSQGWKCKKLCHFGKTTFEGTNIQPIVERRYGQRTPYGQVMSKCEQVRYMTQKYGIDWVTKFMTNEDHDVSHYKDPGAV